MTYQYAEANPLECSDCGAAVLDLNRHTKWHQDQAHAGTAVVSVGVAEPGDLVFFAADNDPPTENVETRLSEQGPWDKLLEARLFERGKWGPWEVFPDWWWWGWEIETGEQLSMRGMVEILTRYGWDAVEVSAHDGARRQQFRKHLQDDQEAPDGD